MCCESVLLTITLFAGDIIEQFLSLKSLPPPTSPYTQCQPSECFLAFFFAIMQLMELWSKMGLKLVFTKKLMVSPGINAMLWLPSALNVKVKKLNEAQVNGGF